MNLKSISLWAFRSSAPLITSVLEKKISSDIRVKRERACERVFCVWACTLHDMTRILCSLLWNISFVLIIYRSRYGKLNFFQTIFRLINFKIIILLCIRTRNVFRFNFLILIENGHRVFWHEKTRHKANRWDTNDLRITCECH